MKTYMSIRFLSVGAVVGAEAECDVTLRPFSGGIDVVGTVRAPWVGICRRCTIPVEGELEIAVSERYGDAPIAEDEMAA